MKENGIFYKEARNVLLRSWGSFIKEQRMFYKGPRDVL